MMNRMKNELIKAITRETGLVYDVHSETFNGIRHGYSFLVNGTGEADEVELRCTVLRNGQPLREAEVPPLSGKFPFLKDLEGRGNSLVMHIRELDSDVSAHQVRTILDELPAYLSSLGFRNVCEECGREEVTVFNYATGTPKLLCRNCVAQHPEMPKGIDIAKKEQEERKQLERPLAGILSGLLGIVIGVLVFQLFYRLDGDTFFASIAAAAELPFMYKLLGRSLTKKGVIICVVMILLCILIGETSTWASELHKLYPQASYIDCFTFVPSLVGAGMVSGASFYGAYAYDFFGAVIGGIIGIVMAYTKF